MLKRITNNKISKLEQDGLIYVRNHPVHDLRILNYTPECQFGKKWTKVTLACRGLVVDSEGEIVARPFRKFFNYGEVSTVPNIDERTRIFEKMDGSMIELFNYNGEWIFATRGSFESDQAFDAPRLFELSGANLDSFDVDYTYIFEYITKENRIVVDYNDYEGLTYLGAIHTKTGNEILSDVDFVSDLKLFKKPNEYKFNSVDEMFACDWSNFEGFVLVFPTHNWKRVKVKLAEYIEIHKAVFNMSSKLIWEKLRDGEYDEWKKNLPDEFWGWVDDIASDIIHKINITAFNVKDDFKRIMSENASSDRKELAEIFKGKNEQSGLYFALLDNKMGRYNDLLFNLAKPTENDRLRK